VLISQEVIILPSASDARLRLGIWARGGLSLLN